MDKSYLILTDSGGIQEEAPSLEKPVLVMREVTERTEGIETKKTKIVGTTTNTIMRGIISALKDEEIYKKITDTSNPYGDGRAAKRIVEHLRRLGKE